MSDTVIVDFSSEVENSAEDQEDDYDRWLTDLWVGVGLTLMVLSCVACLCTFFLLHTFRQWQRRVLEAQRMDGNVEAGYDTESLPSYTVAAGLPTYEEAIEQLKKETPQQTGASSSDPDGISKQFSKLSVGDLFDIYKQDMIK